MTAIIQLLYLFLLVIQTDIGNFKAEPADLKKLGVGSIYESKEVLRVWRNLEGGFPYEDLIEFRKSGDTWSVLHYRYLYDEYAESNLYSDKRLKIDVTDQFRDFLPWINYRLLHKDVQSAEHIFCICDTYRIEYRVGDQGNIFKLDLTEKNLSNLSSIQLIESMKEYFQ